MTAAARTLPTLARARPAPDHLLAVLARSPMATAFVESDGVVRWANDALVAMLGIGDVGPGWHLFDRLEEAEVPRLESALQTASEEGTARMEVRLRRGRREWVETAVVMSSGDDTGHPLVVHVEDLSARASAEATRAKAHARLAALLGNLQAAVLLEDETRHIVLTNQAFCDTFAIPAPPEAMVGMDCSNAAEESKAAFLDPEGFVARIDELLAKRELSTGDLLDLCDGRHLERDYVPVWVGEEYVGHLWCYRDVSDTVIARRRMIRENEQLEVLASRDGLTDLFNRRAILGHLDAALASSDPVSVISVDLDHFKRVNDEHGHAAGDEALVAVAEGITAGRRTADRVGRVGGEELLLVLPGTNAAGAALVAESCREVIAALPLSFGSVTASFGVASTEHASARTAAELLARADQALYRSKENGRDRVTVADPA